MARDGWYVDAPDSDSDVKCLLEGDVDPNPDESSVRLAGTVSKYAHGTEDTTDFLFLRVDEVEPGDPPDSTTADSPTTTSSERVSSPSDEVPDETLGQIAEDQIGDTDLTVTRAEEESTVEQAKKRARDQQRDPAIDPRLQGDDGDDE